MTGFRFGRAGFGLALLLAALAAHAGSAEDAARNFLLGQGAGLGDAVSVTIEPPAAALPDCGRPQAFLPGAAPQRPGRVTVGVRCADGSTRYLQASITARGRYWVAAQPIAAGTLVDAGMLAQREGDLGQLPRGAIRDAGRAVGRVTTRSLAAGAVVQDAQLRAPWLVRHQQPVTVEADGSGFRITRQGQALQDGGLGEPVRVRMSGNSTLNGVVAGNNLVKVNL